MGSGEIFNSSVLGLMIAYLQRIIKIISDFLANFGKTTTSTIAVPSETVTAPTTIVRS